MIKKLSLLGIFFAIFILLPLASQATCQQGYNNCNDSYTYPVYYPVNYPVNYQVNYPVYYNQPVYYNAPEQCQCSGGPCCDGCHFMSEAKICNSESGVEYGCPWGNSCSSDVGSRTRTRLTYCSGSSPVCNGRQTDWSAYSSWTVIQNCGNWQSCSFGSSTCQANANCNTQSTTSNYGSGYTNPTYGSGYTAAPTPPAYVKHSKAICSDDNIYWFDSSGVKNDIYKNCDDTNSCTKDSCADGACSNKLSCDGTTCVLGSADYCKSCLDHCGNKNCDCSEDKTTCPTDCTSAVVSGAVASPSVRSIGAGFISGIKNLFGSILHYWFGWLLIILLIVSIWIFFANTEGGGETAFVYGSLQAVSSRGFWFGVAGIVIIILLLLAANGGGFLWGLLAFIFSRWYLWFIVGLIVLYFIFKILNATIWSKYIVK